MLKIYRPKSAAAVVCVAAFLSTTNVTMNTTAIDIVINAAAMGVTVTLKQVPHQIY